MDCLQYLIGSGWKVVRDIVTPELPPRVTNIHDLGLSRLARNLLAQERYQSGIFHHQHQAIRSLLGGHNVCMTTSTASGKSLVFYVCGTELLQRQPKGTVLAIYPLKALTDEQETKWREAMEATGALKATGADIRVGRIDGSVPQKERKAILTQSSVVIMTPDVAHAWLLSRLSEKYVQQFLKALQLIVIDEAHTYTGVFGSNAAYFFRRLHHAACKLGAHPRYIAASATMYDPARHLNLLTGLEFTIIDRNSDTSGKKSSRILMVEPPELKDVSLTLTNLMRFIAKHEEHRFITFVDSRKQTEHLASVMRRSAETDDTDDEIDLGDDHYLGELERLQVYPFRAGYEAADRKHIQDQLQRGELRGVISTSALEMGIDIPWLTVGILFGIPYSATSYYQRIGRVGRHAPGTVIVVNNGSLLSNRVFRTPELLDHLPLVESALYLENARVQYIHAMCLARRGGEDDSITPPTDDGIEIVPAAPFPAGFLDLCSAERIGEISSELQAMKTAAGNDPNYAFPLRDCETQYRVECYWTGELVRLGSLSMSQVMREAYPGAVYYYQTQPYRVTSISRPNHTIKVKQERRYSTKPSFIPTLIYPNLSKGNVHASLAYGNLHVVECNLQIQETITGFVERRGPNQTTYKYPLNGEPCTYHQSKFDRSYFTSGVLLAHPVLEDGADRQKLAEILFEAFLMQVPTERQDLDCGADRFRASRGSMVEGQHFVCIFDQTYGSLRLSGRLTEPATLRGILDKAIDIASHDETFEVADVELAVLIALQESLAAEPTIDDWGDDPPIVENLVQVIMPDSIGYATDYCEEFYVERVFFSPKGLVYKGKRESQNGQQWDTVSTTLPVDKVTPIQGRSQLGYYDHETGEPVNILVG